jgi:polyhydroxyalkanoate synthase subunit PhaC
MPFSTKPVGLDNRAAAFFREASISSNPTTADEWFKTATERRSSWWPHWDEWVTTFSAGQVAARTPGEGLSVIEEAPGSYVRVRSDA